MLICYIRLADIFYMHLTENEVSYAGRRPVET